MNAKEIAVKYYNDKLEFKRLPAEDISMLGLELFIVMGRLRDESIVSQEEEYNRMVEGGVPTMARFNPHSVGSREELVGAIALTLPESDRVEFKRQLLADEPVSWAGIIEEVRREDEAELEAELEGFGSDKDNRDDTSNTPESSANIHDMGFDFSKLYLGGNNQGDSEEVEEGVSEGTEEATDSSQEGLPFMLTRRGSREPVRLADTTQGNTTTNNHRQPRLTADEITEFYDSLPWGDMVAELRVQMFSEKQIAEGVDREDATQHNVQLYESLVREGVSTDRHINDVQIQTYDQIAEGIRLRNRNMQETMEEMARELTERLTARLGQREPDYPEDTTNPRTPDNNNNNNRNNSPLVFGDDSEFTTSNTDTGLGGGGRRGEGNSIPEESFMTDFEEFLANNPLNNNNNNNNGRRNTRSNVAEDTESEVFLDFVHQNGHMLSYFGTVPVNPSAQDLGDDLGGDIALDFSVSIIYTFPDARGTKLAVANTLEEALDHLDNLGFKYIYDRNVFVLVNDNNQREYARIIMDLDMRRLF